MCLLNARALHENGDLKCFKNNTSKYTVSTQISIFHSIYKKKKKKKTLIVQGKMRHIFFLQNISPNIFGEIQTREIQLWNHKISKIQIGDKSPCKKVDVVFDEC